MASPDAYLPLLQMSIGLQREPNKEPVKEMDPERKVWLKEALANVLKNPADHMREILKKLKENAENAEERERLLKSLAEMVEQVDLAKDLHKIGGLKEMIALINDDNARVRGAAAQVIANAVHNNPEPQKWAMELGALDTLVVMVGNQGATAFETKNGLHALSGLIRHNDNATIRFIKDLQGIALLAKILHSGIETSDPDHLSSLKKGISLILYLVSRAPAVIPPTSSTFIPVILHMLEKHATEPVLRENSVLLLKHYVEDKRVVMEETIRTKTKRALNSVSEIANADDDEAVEEICEDLLKKM